MKSPLFIPLCGIVILLVGASPEKNQTKGEGNETQAITEKVQQDADESTQKISPPKPEPIDEFYNYEEPLYENGTYKPMILYDWKRVKEAYNMKDMKFLRFLCTKVHELAGWGLVKVIDNFIYDRAVIVYTNPDYFPTDTEFLQYVIQLPQNAVNQTDHFFIAEGLKEDCIFYLIPTSRELSSFALGHHVCGIHRSLRGFNKSVTLSPAAAG